MTCTKIEIQLCVNGFAESFALLSTVSFIDSPISTTAFPNGSDLIAPLKIGLRNTNTFLDCFSLTFYFNFSLVYPNV